MKHLFRRPSALSITHLSRCNAQGFQQMSFLSDGSLLYFLKIADIIIMGNDLITCYSIFARKFPAHTPLAPCMNDLILSNKPQTGGSFLLMCDTYKAGSSLMQIASKSCRLGIGFRDEEECQSQLIRVSSGWGQDVWCLGRAGDRLGRSGGGPRALAFYLLHHVRCFSLCYSATTIMILTLQMRKLSHWKCQ